MGDTSSVMISMDADAVPVKKEIVALEKQIKKLENKQLPLIDEFEELRKKAAQAKKAIADADKALAAGKIDKVDHFQITSEASRSIETYSTKIEELRDKIEALDTPILEMQRRMESLKFTGSPDNSIAEVGEQAKKSLGEAAQAASKVTREVHKTKSSFKSVGNAVDNFGKRISNTFKSAFIFSVLYKGLNELKQRLSAMLNTNQQFTTSLNQVKSNLAVAFQPIYQAAMPAINALMQLLVKATAYIAAFVNALFGKSLGSSISAAREMEKSIQAVNSGAKGASAAEKELTAAIKEKQKQVKALQKENKQLQREYEQQKKAIEAQTDALEKQITSLEKEIDAIQKAEDAANKAAAAQREAIQANIKMLQEQQEALKKSNDAQQKALDGQVKKLQSQLDSLQDKYDDETKAIDKQIKGLQNEIKAIQKAQKAAEEAKRANEKFTASFDELSTLGSVDEADPYDAEIEKLQEKIETLQEEKEIKADIYENERDAIQDKIDKLQEEKEAVNEAYDAQNAKIQEQIDLLQKSQDAIKDVDYSASIDGYENKIAAIREQIDTLNDSLKENPQIEQNEILIDQLQEEIDLLQEKKDAIQEASDAASSFDASEITDSNDGLNETATNFANIASKVSEFLLVAAGLATIGGIIFGVIYAVENFSTVWMGLKNVLSTFIHSKLGVFALIVAGISAIVVATGHGEEMINNFKFILEGLSQFIKGVFTGDMELAKEGLINAMKGLTNVGTIVIESFVDMVISGLNWLIRKINSIDIEVPEWVPGIGGTRINPDIPTIPEWNPEKISIPALAQGAVLPPNKPFFAMLSDQKNGTNLEAPASLIEEIMRNVMSEQQYNFNVTANGSLGTLIRLLNLQFTRENNRETAF